MSLWRLLTVFIMFPVFAITHNSTWSDVVLRHTRPFTNYLRDFGFPYAGSCMSAISTLRRRAVKELWVPQVLGTGATNRCGKQWSSGNRSFILRTDSRDILTQCFKGTAM